MEFLYLLEKIRFPGLNEFMLGITTLGDETAFLVLALTVFWCVSKHHGYYLMLVGFIGTSLNQIMKLWFRVPRPWVLDPNFTILEAAREAAAGFSFPSGHSTISVCGFGGLAASTSNKAVRWAAIAICVLVPFSRMYIGVHTPADVLVGVALALALVFLLRPVATGVSDRMMYIVIAVSMLCGMVLLVFASNYPFAIAEDQLHNLQSGLKNGWTMVGCSIGALIVYPLEKKYVNFDTRAVWWAQILKVVLGFAVVMLVKEGMKAPLDTLFAGHMAARGVRYTLIVLVAGVIWPMTFRWFGKLGVKK